MLNVELELKSERDNAEVRVEDVGEYQNVVNAEWNILYQKLDKIAASGAKIVLSKLPIGDVATQYFADRDMFCAGRIGDDDMERTAKACKGLVQSSVNNLTDDNLGQCGRFEEVQIGGERFNIFNECPFAKTCTLILRGGAEQFIAETERSLHDAIMIVRRTIKHDTIVAGGGAIEMELSRHLREYSRTIPGKSQMLIAAYAKALEIIPRQLCDNAGFDSNNVLNLLRANHSKTTSIITDSNDGNNNNNSKHCSWYGVDIASENIADNMTKFVWEPSIMKVNALKAASEAACMILSVDETVKNPSSNQQQPGPMPGGGMGMPGMM